MIRKNLKCRGICYRFAAKKPFGGYRFRAGQRPCSICGIFVDLISYGIRCPCCNNKLRLHSRNTKSRKSQFNLTPYDMLKNAGNLIKSVNPLVLESDQVMIAKLVLNK